MNGRETATFLGRRTVDAAACFFWSSTMVYCLFSCGAAAFTVKACAGRESLTTDAILPLISTVHGYSSFSLSLSLFIQVSQRSFRWWAYDQWSSVIRIHQEKGKRRSTRGDIFSGLVLEQDVYCTRVRGYHFYLAGAEGSHRLARSYKAFILSARTFHSNVEDE